MMITELFERGVFVTTAEVGPPKGINVDHLIDEAKEYLNKMYDLCEKYGITHYREGTLIDFSQRGNPGSLG